MSQDPHEPNAGWQPPAGPNPYSSPSFSTHDAPLTTSQTQVYPIIAGQVKSSASWFFWIAGLSLVNSAIILSGGNWNFVVGLGVTQVVDVVAKQMQPEGGVALVVALFFDLLAAGIFVGFGLLARRMMIWPFVVGMVFYALDGLILLLFRDFMGVGFHAFVLFHLFAGVRALRSLPPAG